MTTPESDQLLDKITEGVKFATQRLIERTKKEDGELVISRDGKVVRRISLATIFIIGYYFSPGQSARQLKILDEEINKSYPAWELRYKDLHANPELSLMEKITSKKIADGLRESGYEVTENFGGYGVVGLMKNGDGPVVLIRTDMDALPLDEKTNLPYSSKVKAIDKNGNEVGVMHACGHDIHMTVFLGVAQSLAKLKNTWKGTLLMIGQPAEEITAGALAMLENDLYKKFPRPDYALAFHDNAFLTAGTVGFTEGPVMASVDRIDITVFGEGAHGAAPHQARDPVLMASQMVLAFQTIVSRENNPTDPMVLTVGSFHSGTTYNIIPSEAKLQLTLRTYSDEVREKSIASIKRISAGIARTAGMGESKLPVIEVDRYYNPPMVNHPEFTRRIKKVTENILGADKVTDVRPVMVGEDFVYYGKQNPEIPACIIWLGAVDPLLLEQAKKEKKNLPGLHSPYFAPLPEPTIKTGVKTMTTIVLDLLD